MSKKESKSKKPIKPLHLLTGPREWTPYQRRKFLAVKLFDWRKNITAESMIGFAVEDPEKKSDDCSFLRAKMFERGYLCKMEVNTDGSHSVLFRNKNHPLGGVFYWQEISSSENVSCVLSACRALVDEEHEKWEKKGGK